MTAAERSTATAEGRAWSAWGRVEDREVHAIFAPLGELKPPRSDAPPPVGKPGVLEELRPASRAHPRTRRGG